MDNLHDFFEQIVCVNLSHRPDRWRLFQNELSKSNWPFRPASRFSAIDGKLIGAPAWFAAGDGAWGCLQSHIRILEDALHNGTQSLLIVEDDIVLCDHFTDLATGFISQLPRDWHGIMLGGQHLECPVPINDCVVRVRNGNRTHAYALRGPFIRTVYRHLCNFASHAREPAHHIDHRLGLLHRDPTNRVYAPAMWLIGQAEGMSDIQDRVLPVRFWNTEHTLRVQKSDLDNGITPRSPLRLVGVLGTSYSALMPALLRLLGVYVAHDRLCCRKYSQPHLTTNFDRLCQRLFHPHHFAELCRPHERTRRLRKWLSAFTSKAAAQGYVLAGILHPKLCLLASDLMKSTSAEIRFIAFEKAEQLSAIQQPRNDCACKEVLSNENQQKLSVARTRFLSERHHLVIKEEQLLTQPLSEISRIIEYLDIPVTRGQLMKACNYVGNRSQLATIVSEFPVSL